MAVDPQRGYLNEAERANLDIYDEFSEKTLISWLTYKYLGASGGDGCHLRVVPPGQLHRRPSTPKRFINIVFFSRNYIWV